MSYVMPSLPLSLEQAIARMEGWYAEEVTRCQRNNNPGNIVYGSFARSHGAVGSDGRFAKWATPEAGFQALHDLLSSQHYFNLTIEAALNSYAPMTENDTETYVANVCDWTASQPDTLVSERLSA